MYANTNAVNDKPRQEMSTQQAVTLAVFVVGIVGAMWVDQNSKAIERFHFENYEYLWMGAWFGCLAIIWAIKYFLAKGTHHIEERYKNLKPLLSSFASLYVGKTKDGVSLFLPWHLRTGHTQIVGSTGRGKTESTIKPWAVRDLLQNTDTIVIDGKGSRGLADELKGICTYRCIDFFLFDLSDIKNSIKINPLASGSAQQITDRLFSSFDFDDTYYKSVQYDICGAVIELIHEKDEVVTFKRLHSYLTDDKVLAKALSTSKNTSLIVKLKSFLSESKTERQRKLSGVLSQIGPFATGEIASLVNGGEEYGPDSVSRILNTKSGYLKGSPQPYCFAILLPTLKYQKMAAQLGKMILQDMAWAISEREGESCNRKTAVYLDEFSSLVYEGFINILNKARSTDVAFHLAHQSLGDLSAVSEDFAGSVNTNTNIKCLFGLNDPDTSEFFARHLGTSSKTKYTKRARKKTFGDYDETEEASIREVEAYKVHPNELKHFTSGQGVFHVPAGSGPITEVIQFQALSAEEYEAVKGDL